jgi:LmbE family N-acetylglucosaminyl deacetylase
MPEELTDIRDMEAKAAADVIGAKHYSLGVGDMHVKGDDQETIRKISEIVGEFRPDVIITHYDQDYMDDHIQTYRATFNATFAASLPHYNPANEGPTAPLTPIIHMDTLSGVGFIPTEYVDISNFIKIKLKALACHESQIKWMLDHDHIDFIDFVQTCSKLRGYQCGAAYAEGFRPNFNYLRLTTKRLLP